MSLEIINVIDLVDDGKPAPRNFDECDTIVVHRCGKDLILGIDLGDTAEEVCAHFTGRNTQYPEVAKATGGQLAYSLMIGGDLGDPRWDGVIWQCLAIGDVGYHARRWSKPAVGVALIADPRKKPPSTKQRNALVDLLALLSVGFGFDPFRIIKGHDELPSGSADPNKRCPGPLLPMNPVRADVADIVKDGARQRLHEAGLVFSKAA
jgi:hypothetical protein